jgi:hypothetical protein
VPLAGVRESAGMLQLGGGPRIERKISGHKDLNSERKRKRRKLGIRETLGTLILRSQGLGQLCGQQRGAQVGD